MQEQRALGDILMRHGVVTPEALEPLYAEQREKPVELFDLVVQNQLATDAAVARALARECGFAYLEQIDDEAIALTDAMRLPLSYARSHRLLVLKEDEDSVSVVCGDPLDTAALDDVRATFGKRLVVSVSSPAVVNEAINRVYERQDTTSDLEGKVDDVDDPDAIDILESDDDAPIIRWVNSLFAQAAKERASDIHIEPEEKEVLVRYRVDGELYVARKARRQFMSSVIARVKIMAGLNIAEKRLPQDGRISLRIAGRAIDVRVSTVPTSREHERIVMRLLNKASVLLDLPDLGFSQRDFLLMDGLIHKPDGIILVTGPTGSGKTTTLYACINRINHPNINILTAEDPVEYEISGIHQLPVQPKIGLTFASALRAFLRQDPDVIMVGEIRDKETAEIAMHASMTGHLVLSTIHTNDAASAFTRLIQMEIEAFRVRSTVVGVLAQRLVRVLCPRCKEPYTGTPYELEQLGIDPVRTRRRDERRLAPAYVARTADGAAPYEPVGWRQAQMPRLYRARGCEACDNKGFSGRLGIYELLLADDAVGEAVMQSSDAQSIRRVAQARGMDTLRDDGARKALAGITTVEEVVAATQDDMFDE